MADLPADRVKVRHKSSLAETDFDRAAFEAGFFPDYEPVEQPKKSTTTGKES